MSEWNTRQNAGIWLLSITNSTFLFADQCNYPTVLLNVSRQTWRQNPRAHISYSTAKSRNLSPEHPANNKTPTIPSDRLFFNYHHRLPSPGGGGVEQRVQNTYFTLSVLRNGRLFVLRRVASISRVQRRAGRLELLGDIKLIWSHVSFVSVHLNVSNGWDVTRTTVRHWNGAQHERRRHLLTWKCYAVTFG